MRYNNFFFIIVHYTLINHYASTTSFKDHHPPSFFFLSFHPSSFDLLVFRATLSSSCCQLLLVAASNYPITSLDYLLPGAVMLLGNSSALTNTKVSKVYDANGKASIERGKAHFGSDLRAKFCPSNVWLPLCISPLDSLGVRLGCVLCNLLTKTVLDTCQPWKGSFTKSGPVEDLWSEMAGLLLIVLLSLLTPVTPKPRHPKTECLETSSDVLSSFVLG